MNIRPKPQAINGRSCTGLWGLGLFGVWGSGPTPKGDFGVRGSGLSRFGLTPKTGWGIGVRLFGGGGVKV
jgi:hypothetical protein